jgi:hypothetical protein
MTPGCNARLLLQVLDVCTLVKQEYWELKEASLFLLASNSLPPDAALGLYVKAGPSEWLYRGCVHNGHPSEVMPLQVGMGKAVVSIHCCHRTDSGSLPFLVTFCPNGRLVTQAVGIV